MKPTLLTPPLPTPTLFTFEVDAPSRPNLHGAQILIAAPDAAEAERLASIRSTVVYGAPLRRALPRVTEIARVRGAA